MDTQVVIQLSLAIIAVVGALKTVLGDSISGWVTVAVAGSLGLIAGILGTYGGVDLYAGIDPLTGLMAGLAASGSVKLTRQIQGE